MPATSLSRMAQRVACRRRMRLSASMDHADQSYGKSAGSHCRAVLLLGSTGMFAGFSTASAASEMLALPFGIAISSTDVVNIAMMVGALSAAMISAVWLIRERAKLDVENGELRTALADANLRIDRYRSLTVDKDRRIVIWDEEGTSAELLGELPPETGAPEGRSAFLAFGRWLLPPSAVALERAIGELRSGGRLFDIVVETARGNVIEAQGRVSGGRAFVRFVMLGDLRARMAGTEADRDRLAGTVETIQNLLDALETPVWLRGPDGRLLWVNQAYAEAVEAVDSAEVVTRESELIGTHARSRIRAQATSGRPFADKVSTVVRGNRTIYDIVDVTGAAGSAGIATDVSEVEEVREELKRTLRSHSETLDHLATAVAIFGRDQNLQFYNQAFQTLWDLDTPFLESRPDNAELLERLRVDGRLPEQHSWREWKDSVLSVYRSVEPQRNFWYLPDGRTLNVFATAHPQGGATWVFENLTDQVDLETRYNTLVKVQGETIDHLSEGVGVFGPDGRLRLSNPAFCVLWDIPEAEMAPGTHVNVIAAHCERAGAEPVDWRHFAAIITSLDEERRTHEGRIELGTGLILDYALVPLPNGQTMMTFVNVTDRTLVERALTEKNEALQKADALKNDFVKHVSYELRTPLTNIIGFADLLKTPSTGELTARQADYVDHIATSSSVLLTIVNDILDLATVDAGIMKLETSEIDINELLQEAAAQSSDRLKENGLTLRLDNAGSLGSFVADRQRVRQILSKLLANAANYAPEGSEIVLSARRELQEVLFTVTDTGPGIPKHMQPTIFSRFETHGGGGRRRGAGLGLSIVDSFVSLHHGTVEVVSEEGEGTSITCRLPANRMMHTEAAE